MNKNSAEYKAVVRAIDDLPIEVLDNVFVHVASLCIRCNVSLRGSGRTVLDHVERYCAARPIARRLRRHR